MSQGEKIWIFIIAIAVAFYILYVTLDAGDVEAATNVGTDASTAVDDSLDTGVDLFADAIADEEGFFNSTSNIPQKANNPLDLELGDVGYGTMSAAGGQQITIFPTLTAGWAAAVKLLGKDIAGTKLYPAGESISQFMSTFTSGKSGNSGPGNTVASDLGVDPSTPVSNY
jgi:hypothetical protein